MATRTRGANGRYIRTIKAVQRDFDAAALRSKGASFDRIAAELGFASRGHAHDAVRRALRDVPYEDADEDKRLDLERINRLIEHLWAVMERDHLTVSQGRVVGKLIGVERDTDGSVVYDQDGKAIPVFEDVLDDGPGVQAAREIRALLERRAKIVGYDAPVKTRIEVITEDAVDAECKKIEMEIRERETRAADPRTAGEDTPTR